MTLMTENSKISESSFESMRLVGVFAVRAVDCSWHECNFH